MSESQAELLEQAHLDRLDDLPTPTHPAHYRLLLRRPDGSVCEHEHPHEISDLLQQPEMFVWLDLAHPGPDEIDLLSEEFDFHPLAIEDAIRQHQRPKIDVYNGYYFLVFYALCAIDGGHRIDAQQIAMFVGPKYVVTIHRGVVQVIDETRNRLQQAPAALASLRGLLVYNLLDAMVDDYFPLIDHLADHVEELEERIFTRFDRRALQGIFELKHELLKMRRVVAPERDVLNTLLRREVPIFDSEVALYFQDVYDHLLRVTDSLDTYRELLTSAQDAYLSVQSNELNQVMKVLTIASIALMSAALIAGIYGMNFEVMPELRWQWGYPFALGLMAAVVVSLLVFFRWKKWL